MRVYGLVTAKREPRTNDSLLLVTPCMKEVVRQASNCCWYKHVSWEWLAGRVR